MSYFFSILFNPIFSSLRLICNLNLLYVSLLLPKLNNELNTLKERMGELEKKFEQFEKNNKEEKEKKKNQFEISQNVVNELVFPSKNIVVEPVIAKDKSEKEEKEKNDENSVEIKNISNDSDDIVESDLNNNEVERK